MLNGKQKGDANIEVLKQWIASKTDEDFRQIEFKGKLKRKEIAVECGFALPPPPPPRVMVRDLVEVFAREPADVKAEYLARMARTAVEKGYKPGWVGFKYQAKYGARLSRGAVDRAIEQARSEASCPGPNQQA